MNTARSVLLLCLFSGAVSPRSLEKSSAHPPTHVVTPRMRLIKTEMLLSKILGEMNMNKPPLMNGPLNISQTLVNLLENREVEESILGDGDNLVATPLNENASCINGTACSRYEFELNPENKPLSAFHLWFRKMSPDDQIDMAVCWFTVTMVNEDPLCDHLKNVTEVKSELGWGIYELPNRLQQEYSSEQLFCTVEINGPSMQEYDHTHKPFLVASLNPSAVDRKRRSATSSAAANKNCSCCRVDFYVSFKQIGWYWVVAPVGFNANMCSGKCSNQLNTYPSHYHQMLSTILNNKTTPIDDNKEDLWTPCCSPTKLSPLNMIYVAGNNTNTNSSSYSLVYHKIPNMITESCGCW